MARTRQVTRIISLLPFAFVLFATRPVNATNQQGITATYYQITDVPPTKSDSAYQSCGQETENNINRNFEGEPFPSCPDDLFMVHYQGFLTVPAHQTIQFWLAADDGGTMKIGDYEWGEWNDKGCTASVTDPLTLSTNQPLTLDGWFYENSGATCFMLAWMIDNTYWEIVPDSAFTTNGQTPPAPTTLPETTTTTSTTTTTVPITTTTETPATTTTVQQSTTTTTSSTTTAVPESTTTTVPVTSLPVPASSTSTVQQTVPDNPTTTVDVIADVTTTTQPEQTTTTTQPVQEPTWSTLPDTPDFQSATLVRGGAIGKGLKPTRLISNGLREGVTPAQQRMAVTAAVMIAIPSPITVSRRKT